MDYTKLLEAALNYYDRGWSLVPIKAGTKLAARKWKQYQTDRASQAQVRKWFELGSTYGIAVVFGEASGGLVSRDFDVYEAYQQWASEQPELAACLPTVKTPRGAHVYAYASAENVRELRRLLQKPPDAPGAIPFADGELRAGIGCLSVLPPSRHPSGHVYTWNDPRFGEIPEIDLKNSGWICSDATQEGHRKDTGRTQEGLRKDSSNNPNSQLEFSKKIQEAILDTLPTGPGTRHKQVFELARALKAIPEVSEASAKDLLPIVKRWHEMALENITTKAFEDTMMDFTRCWPKVKHPRGFDPMMAILERARAKQPPSSADRIDQPEFKLLVAICRELANGRDGRFFLSCRTAARLVEKDYKTANRWLSYLVQVEGILELVSTGTLKGRRASEYRYLPQD